MVNSIWGTCSTLYSVWRGFESILTGHVPRAQLIEVKRNIGVLKLIFSRVSSPRLKQMALYSPSFSFKLICLSLALLVWDSFLRVVFCVSQTYDVYSHPNLPRLCFSHTTSVKTPEQITYSFFGKFGDPLRKLIPSECECLWLPTNIFFTTRFLVCFGQRELL